MQLYILCIQYIVTIINNDIYIYIYKNPSELASNLGLLRNKVGGFQNMDPSQLALIKQLIAEAEAKKEGKDTQPIDKTSAPPTPGPAAAAAAVATHCHSKPAETAKDMQGSKGVPQNGDGEDPVKLKQFWSKFKVGAQPSQTPVPEQSRQPSSTPEPDQIAKLSEAPVPEQPAPEQTTAPEQTPMLDTKTEIWHTLMDHEGWKQKLKDHVGTRWDFKSFS